MGRALEAMRAFGSCGWHRNLRFESPISTTCSDRSLCRGSRALEILSRGAKRTRRALECVEGRQSPLARKRGCVGRACGPPAGPHMLRCDRDREWLVRALCEARESIQQRDGVFGVDWASGAAKPQSRPDLHHDRVDNRIAVENVEYAIDIILAAGRARSERPRGVKRIAVAAANHLEEALELGVRSFRQRRNFESM